MHIRSSKNTPNKGLSEKEKLILATIKNDIEKNKRTNIHFYEGRFWASGASKNIADQIKGVSKRSVDNASLKLINIGIIIERYFSDTVKRTRWFSIEDTVDE